jgi:uncharacterized protein (TIGR03086 family)
LAGRHEGGGIVDATTYERALDATRTVVAGTRQEQLDDPTPCSEWSVRDLLNHMVGGCLAWASGARGKPRKFDEEDHTGHDYAAAFEEASRSALDAFRQPGAMDHTFKMSWGDTPGSMALGLAVADAAVHGWDLARATGQTIEIEDDVANDVFGMTTQMMEPLGSFPRGASFGEPLRVPDDAPIVDRMVAYLGRHP